MDSKMKSNNIKTTAKPLQIFQWNIRSINKNKTSLIQTLIESNFDVLLLQSLLSSAPPALPGYNLISANRRPDGKYIDTAIYVSHSLDAQESASPLPVEKNLSSCACDIKTEGDVKLIKCVSVYYPKGVNHHNLDFLANYRSSPSNNIIIGGDFNDHHILWSNKQHATTHPTPFSDAVSDADLHILNDGSITHIPDIDKHRHSAIDITFCNPELAPKTSWQTLPELKFTSDHMPLLTTIDIIPTLSTDEFEPQYNYDRANWELFRIKLKDYTIENMCSDDINIYSENISKVIDLAASQSIPLTKPPKKGVSPNAWWNEDCQKAKKIFEASNKFNYQHFNVDSKNAVIEAKQKYEFTMAKAKLQHWEHYVNNKIRDYRDIKYMWYKLRKFKKRRPVKSKLRYNGEDFSSNKDKAKILSQHIAKNSQNGILTNNERQDRQNFENTYQHPVPNNSNSINLDISFNELQRALDSITDVKKKGGFDPVTYSMLKNLPSSFLEVILHFFNQCYKTEQIPAHWKHAEVIALHKPGKPRTDPHAYRPISLTSHTSKLYERILNSRLVEYLEKNNTLPNNQAGFQKFRSVQDHITYIVEQMRCTHRNIDNVMYSTFFDVQKAFDRVWHCKLLSQLKNIGISGHFYHTIENFLSNRYISVKVGSELSEPQPLHMGTPQVAVLSPTLFAIMLHDIDNLNTPGNTLLLYADDITIISDIGKLSKENKKSKQGSTFLLREHQKAVDTVSEYMKTLGFNFSSEKTQFMVTARSQIAQKCKIKINGTDISPSNTVKYLGVYIDRHLTWTTHIDHLIAKANKATNLIKVLAKENWARGSKFLVNVSKALVRSVLSYGQEVYFTACNTYLKKLEVAELKALKIALGLRKHARTDMVYAEVQWLRLEEERKLRCSQFAIRLQTIQGNLTKTTITNHFGQPNQFDAAELEKHKHIGRTTTSIYQFTKPILEKCSFSLEEIENYTPPPSPYWTLPTPKCEFSLPDNFRKLDHPNLAFILAREKLEKYNNHFQIYTDGSVLENGKAGCAAISLYPGGKRGETIETSLNNNISCFSAEMHGLSNALDLADQDTYENILIATDSLSSMQALQNKPKHNFHTHYDILLKLKALTIQGKDITFLHIPSHVGIRGNNLADISAKRAAINNSNSSQCTKNNDYKYTRNEAKTLLWKTCKTHDSFPSLLWYPEQTGNYPTMPSNLLTIWRRIRTSSCIFHINDPNFQKYCGCGKIFDFRHLDDECDFLKPYFENFHQYLQTKEINRVECTAFHETLGWEPALILTSSIYHSPFAYLF